MGRSQDRVRHPHPGCPCRLSRSTAAATETNPMEYAIGFIIAVFIALSDRSGLLPLLMFPVGAEVGFSSAGAGALGSAALLSLTPLTPAQVVGTDILFGFLLSLIGSGAHGFFRGTSSSLLQHLILGGLGGVLLRTPFSPPLSHSPLPSPPFYI